MLPKEPKSAGASSGKKKSSITIVKKKEIIARYDAGVRIKDLVIEFGMPKSSIGTILKKQQQIVGADVARGVVHIFNILKVYSRLVTGCIIWAKKNSNFCL